MSSFFQTALGEMEIMQVNEIVALLNPFTNEEIETGLQQYQISGPRTQAGYLRKPAPGDLYQFIMNIRDLANFKKLKPKEMPNAVTDTTPISMKPINQERKESSDRIFKEMADKYPDK